MATFPERVLAAVNVAVVAASDVILGALSALPAVAGLVVASLVTAAFAVFVIGWTSNQRVLVQTRRGIHAGLFEIRLFADDPVATLRALGEIIGHTARHLRLSLVPLAWMALPLMLAMAQLDAFYGYAGLTPGESALVTARLGEGSSAATGLVLEAPSEVLVETAAVRLPESNEVVWRIVPRATGAYTLTIRDGDTALNKSIVVSDRPARRSPRRGTGVVDQLLYPSEPPLPAGGAIAAISVSYSRAEIEWWGPRLPWLVVYLVCSTIGVIALARWYRVTI